MLEHDFDLFSVDPVATQAASETARYLADSQHHLGRMLELMPIGVLIHSEQSIVFANRQSANYLGAGADQLRGHHLFDFVALTDLVQVKKCLEAAFVEDASAHEVECAVERADGTSRLMKIIAARLPWHGTPVVQLLLQDITEQKRAETSLRQMTITDELTGSYNRRHALYEASLYLEAAQKEGVPFSVISIDIDRFKSVNDTYGHDIGDLVLKTLAQRAADFLATRTELNSSIFARMGGEEFLFLLPATPERKAVQCADEFRQLIGAMSLQIISGSMSITLSAGVATYKVADGGSLHNLLKRADIALYAAKSGGRNRVVLAN
jgi:diguanylate cyclase (GGDEF)-like protein/PAS domain S-box-containing protein